MASSPEHRFSWRELSREDLQELKKVVWGNNATEEVFLRWSQGVTFSDCEPTAILQRGGGPCAMLAPLQAYLLKNLLFTQDEGSLSDVNLESVSDECIKQCLYQALVDVFMQVAVTGKIVLVACPKDINIEDDDEEQEASQCNKRPKFSIDGFHNNLVFTEVNKDDVFNLLTLYIPHVTAEFGVLCFLYSVILTTGLDRVQADGEEPGPLIDPVHGHGGQSLVNLLLTGKATPNVFDGERDLGGIICRGITCRPCIGFLTVLEAHKLLEVGWNFKSPKYPIWVLGSETHLSVLFSKSKDVIDEDQHTALLQTIRHYETDGNGFIKTDDLKNLMQDLQLVCEPDEYVELMKSTLDPEDLGVILVNKFLDTFYPKQQSSCDFVRQFHVYHYNGIKRSNDSNKIRYRHATAKLKDLMEPTVVADSSDIYICLQTKWPTIELLWDDGVIPSVN